MTGEDARPTPAEWNMGLTWEDIWVRELLLKNKMADKSCSLLEGKEASDFIASMDTFIFDCDGI